MDINLQTRNRRYRLHYKVRKQGYRINIKSKTIFAPYTSQTFSTQVKQLIHSYNYVIQSELE